MLTAIISKLVPIFLTVCIPVVYSECKNSYMTICDTVEDLNFEILEHTTDLIIGTNGTLRENPTSFSLLNLASLHQLQIFILMGQLDTLKPTPEGSAISNEFSFFGLYGNVLRQIHENHFPVFSARKLSLVNNKIELIEQGTFERHKVETFDFSDNLLEVIEHHVFPPKQTKRIILRRNRLTYIERFSFPNSLVELNLDWNNLEYIQKNVLDELKYLEKFTASHNKLTAVPFLGGLGKLTVIDLSFNDIAIIETDTFVAAFYLRFLDLSHNKISDPDIIHNLFLEDEQTFLKINLAFNNLRYLKLRTLTYLADRTFALYGNPWDCAKIQAIAKVLICHVTECELKYFSSGQTPFCIDYNWKRSNYTSNAYEDVRRFQNAIRKHEHLVGCNLSFSLAKYRRAKPNIPLCDDSDDQEFRLSLIEDRIESLLD